MMSKVERTPHSETQVKKTSLLHLGNERSTISTNEISTTTMTAFSTTHQELRFMAVWSIYSYTPIINSISTPTTTTTTTTTITASTTPASTSPQNLRWVAS
ncbi:hypothetical protein E2C01_047097 [Portunus trituberculatus]|uniref:Uncharacterized protein n=1 Tax=Portunus trituberculatus TaxID=210409 RepID=A0A5B7G6I4_PORTR|nr:hypothetical protein [Portunus trituberculatus]